VEVHLVILAILILDIGGNNMANDDLFMALAQAKARPDRWARALNAGTGAVRDIVGGYMEGRELQQQLQQYKTLNTRLGDIFPPDSIPGGLTPDHTVGQLMQLAPILPYTRSPVADSIANQLSGGTSESPTPTVSAPVQAPSPTIASTSMAPIPGAENPAPPTGSTNLSAIQGAGGGGGANLPPGTSPTIPSGPSFKGMSYMDLQRYGPYLNDIRQGRQFQQGQTNENERARLSREQQHQQFLDAQAAEEARFQRGKVAEAATGQRESVANLGTIDTAVAGLKDALKNNVPSPLANIRANISEAAGTPSPYGIPIGSGSAQKVNEAAAATRAALATEITRTGRYTPFVDQILNAMVPTAKDQNWQDKIGLINRFRAAVASGSQQNIDNAISAATGGTVVVPQAPPNSSTPPSQILTVRTSDGVVHRIPSANFGKAKQRDPGLQLVSQ
jgi:hypothetical protein